MEVLAEQEGVIQMSVNTISAIITIALFVGVYSAINGVWWLSTNGEDSFTKHILFCWKNSRNKKREAELRKERYDQN